MRLLGRRKALPFDLRFHLAPGVEATPTADGKGFQVWTDEVVPLP